MGKESKSPMGAGKRIQESKSSGNAAGGWGIGFAEKGRHRMG